LLKVLPINAPSSVIYLGLPANFLTGCYQPGESNLAELVAERLFAAGHAAAWRINDTGARIYAVLKDGATHFYLNLVSVRDGVLYTLGEAPLSQAEFYRLMGS
jgi:hypothetical protein